MRQSDGIDLNFSGWIFYAAVIRTLNWIIFSRKSWRRVFGMGIRMSFSIGSFERPLGLEQNMRSKERKEFCLFLHTRKENFLNHWIYIEIMLGIILWMLTNFSAGWEWQNTRYHLLVLVWDQNFRNESRWCRLVAVVSCFSSLFSMFSSFSPLFSLFHEVSTTLKVEIGSCWCYWKTTKLKDEEDKGKNVLLGTRCEKGEYSFSSMLHYAWRSRNRVEEMRAVYYDFHTWISLEREDALNDGNLLFGSSSSKRECFSKSIASNVMDCELFVKAAQKL